MDEIFERLPYESREKWLELRNHGIGGSDSSCVIGRNPYKTNIELWREKVGLMKLPDIQNKHTLYGTVAEEPIRKLFELDYQGVFQLYYSQDLLVRKDKPYIRGTLDGEITVLQTTSIRSFWKNYYVADYKNSNVIVTPPEKQILLPKMRGVFECKTTEVMSSAHKEKWDNAIPMNYYIQLLHYLLVSNYDFFVLRVKLKNQDANEVVTHEFRDYCLLRKHVEKDMTFLEKNETEFWTKYVLDKVEPPLRIVV